MASHFPPPININFRFVLFTSTEKFNRSMNFLRNIKSNQKIKNIENRIKVLVKDWYNLKYICREQLPFSKNYRSKEE